jgi:uncharacterized membrane protein YfcA
MKSPKLKRASKISDNLIGEEPWMNPEIIKVGGLFLIGIGVGVGAAFTGLGGGFLMVPLLIMLGYDAQKTVGTSCLAILIISISALIAHNKLANVDYKVGALLGVGGIIGAQVGARLVEHVSTASFKRIFALVLLGLAAYLFFKKG